MDEKKFPELASSKYLKKYINAETQDDHDRATDMGNRLEKDGILNLFDIPHFRRSTKINTCVKMLLSCVHRGYLWLDRPVSLDTDLIV
jgi:hypothetical protein